MLGAQLHFAVPPIQPVCRITSPMIMSVTTAYKQRGQNPAIMGRLRCCKFALQLCDEIEQASSLKWSPPYATDSNPTREVDLAPPTIISVYGPALLRASLTIVLIHCHKTIGSRTHNLGAYSRGAPLSRSNYRDQSLVFRAVF